MNRITNITKRDIKELLSTGIDIGVFESDIQLLRFSGVLTDVEFLSRLYDLTSIPSEDSRFKTIDGEIWQHTENNDDYPNVWVFDDNRFPLANGTDEDYLCFLCEMFHPEVRDEKQNWRLFLSRINDLLRQDSYELFPNGVISGRDIYFWRDLTNKNRFTVIESHDIDILLSLFIRSGYVLDFTNSSFNEFTKETIGVELMNRYSMSKGKSLREFTKDASESEIIDLLQAFMKYYEDSPKYFVERTTDKKFEKLYNQCKDIIVRWNRSTPVIKVQIESAAANFSNEYIKGQFDLMVRFQKENPTEAIGKAKELIESCCKTILEKAGATYEKSWDINRLLKETRQLLHLMPEDIPEDIAEATAMKSLLASLANIANNIAQLRNSYGSGHGKSDNYKGLQERHAKLAIGCSMTLVDFLWDSYQRQFMKS